MIRPLTLSVGALRACASSLIPSIATSSSRRSLGSCFATSSIISTRGTIHGVMGTSFKAGPAALPRSPRHAVGLLSFALVSLMSKILESRPVWTGQDTQIRK
jgi:hypothetical protein